MRILFVNRKYDGIVGGVERMSVAMMNEMCKRGHDIFLLSWDDENATSFYELDERIQWYKMAVGNPDYKADFKTKLKRAQKVRKACREIKPDVIIGFQDGAFRGMKFYTLGMGIPVVAAERNAPSRFDHIEAGKRKNIIFQSFRLAEKITIQCESYRDEYPAYLRHKIVTISNPVNPAQKFSKPSGEKGQQKYLLSIGRLCFQKNYMALLEAYKKIYQSFPDWKLVIVGGGEDREKLDSYIKEHHLQEFIELAGETDDVARFYTQSHLFCLPSRWEGFPNVLAEAMSHGLPAVGYAECSGTRDLIVPGKTGFLADGNGDVVSLSQTLKKAMEDDALRAQMGAQAIESMKQYEPALIFDQWEALFKEAARS